MNVTTTKDIIIDGDKALATLTLTVSDCETCIAEIEMMLNDAISEYKRRKKSKPCGGCGGKNDVS